MAPVWPCPQNSTGRGNHRNTRLPEHGSFALDCFIPKLAAGRISERSEKPGHPLCKSRHPPRVPEFPAPARRYAHQPEQPPEYRVWPMSAAGVGITGRQTYPADGPARPEGWVIPYQTRQKPRGHRLLCAPQTMLVQFSHKALFARRIHTRKQDGAGKKIHKFAYSWTPRPTLLT